MKIGFAGAMVGTENMFHLVAEDAMVMGHEAVVLPAPPNQGGEPWSHSQIMQMVSCDVVLFGLSSFPEERASENALAEVLVREGTPFVVMEDIPDAYCRVDSRDGPIVSGATAVITATLPGVERASAFGYKDATYIGLPPHVLSSYSKMISPETLQFECYQGAVSIPVDDTHVVLFLGGTKDFAQDMKVLRYMKEAGLAHVYAKDQLVIGYRAHPALAKNPDNKEALAAIDDLLSDVWRLDYADADMPETIRNVTLTVFTGMPTDSLAAAHAGMRAIYYSDAEVEARNMRQGSLGGRWAVAVDKGMIDCRDPGRFTEFVGFALGPLGRAFLSERQEANFPKPTDFGSAVNTVKFLENMISR